MYPDRQAAARMASETLGILEAGAYVPPSGRAVPIRDALAAAVRGTVSYPPERAVARPRSRGHATAIEVRNESTLDAAAVLAAEGGMPAALNFASATKPGGGFISGARAQEESLARASGLYACLRDQPMYDHHQRVRNPMYTSWAIYSPAVPVFRRNEGPLLEAPYACAFITAAAVNAKVVLERDPRRGPEIRAVMRERIARVLAIAAAHDHEALVLGAWGCGVFGNDVAEVADLFGDALDGQVGGVFRRVVFAILDSSAEARFIGPFRSRFAR